MNLVLILGNQLFDPKIFKYHGIDSKKTIFFLREDQELASYYKFHKHKVIFFFSAMRAYSAELKEMGYSVHYEKYQTNKSVSKNGQYDIALTEFIKNKKITTVFCF